jgi:hypothetical protein
MTMAVSFSAKKPATRSEMLRAVLIRGFSDSDAYVKGDVETLKLWLSDAQFHVYAALAKQYTTAGLKWLAHRS